MTISNNFQNQINQINEEEEEGRWKNLNTDILALILKRFDKKPDICRFRSICKTWRLFATPIQPHLQFPLILPPLHPKTRFFSLSPTILYIFSPKLNPNNEFWLSKVAETGENKWALLNPLTKHKLYFFSSGVFRNGINLMGFNNHEVGRSYRLQLIRGVKSGNVDDSFDFEEFSSSISLRKFVVNIGDRVSVLGFFGYGEIGVWNSGDDKWRMIETGKRKWDFDDVICYLGKFYAVDRTGRLVMIDPLSDSRELVEVVCPGEDCEGHYTYLVESDFRLYMVSKTVKPMPRNYYNDDENEWIMDKSNIGQPLKFKVFVLKNKEMVWEKVSSLGDKVFFVSRDATLSVSAKDLGWTNGNYIYFEGLSGFDDEADMSFGLNAGVYTMENQAIVTFDSTIDNWTKIFWPPSSWFVENEEYPECEMMDSS